MRHLLLLLVAIILISCAYPKIDLTPEQLISKLYERRQSIDLENKDQLKEFFTPEFVSLWVKDAERCRNVEYICSLDFEPFLDSQDYDDNLDVKLELTLRKSSDKFIVTANFCLTNDCAYRNSVQYLITMTDDGYRIADVIYKGNRDSLFTTLREWNK